MVFHDIFKTLPHFVDIWYVYIFLVTFVNKLVSFFFLDFNFEDSSKLKI